MSCNVEDHAKIKKAFRANNVEEFRRLLKLHPEHLIPPDGKDYWMKSAAMNNQLEMLNVVVELGLDVNLGSDPGLRDEPFYTPEGPILQAAGKGYLAIVQWLLDNGAKINYTVHGEDRCLPLTRASIDGHFDVVKLLVERGANVHGTFQGATAADQAKTYGHTEIEAYLRDRMKETKKS